MLILGQDDVVTKPFRVHDLIAQMHAVRSSFQKEQAEAKGETSKMRS